MEMLISSSLLTAAFVTPACRTASLTSACHPRGGFAACCAPESASDPRFTLFSELLSKAPLAAVELAAASSSSGGCALVTTKDRKEMWGLVREMSSIGMRPNAVTCSIILKSLTAHSAAEDVRQAMALIDNMHEDMDEVLTRNFGFQKDADLL